MKTDINGTVIKRIVKLVDLSKEEVDRFAVNA